MVRILQTFKIFFQIPQYIIKEYCITVKYASRAGWTNPIITDLQHWFVFQGKENNENRFWIIFILPRFHKERPKEKCIFSHVTYLTQS